MHAHVQFTTTWRKSSFSGTDSDCVEVAFGRWRKSSYSGSDADCVEIAMADDAVGVRDSKNTAGPALAVTADSWRRLVDSMQ